MKIGIGTAQEVGKGIEPIGESLKTKTTEEVQLFNRTEPKNKQNNMDMRFQDSRLSNIQSI